MRKMNRKTAVPHRYRVTMDLCPPSVADAAEELE